MAGGVPHQGLIARRLREAGGHGSTSCSSRRATPALVVVLDGVEDPRNLGAILRTVEAAGADGVLLPDRHSAGLSETVSRASAGGLEHVQVARIGNVVQAIEELKARGCWVVGFDAAGTERWDAVDYRRPIALVLGGEGRGIRRLVREHCDHLVVAAALRPRRLAQRVGGRRHRALRGRAAARRGAEPRAADPGTRAPGARIWGRATRTASTIPAQAAARAARTPRTERRRRRRRSPSRAAAGATSVDRPALAGTHGARGGGRAAGAARAAARAARAAGRAVRRAPGRQAAPRGAAPADARPGDDSRARRKGREAPAPCARAGAPADGGRRAPRDGAGRGPIGDRAGDERRPPGRQAGPGPGAGPDGPDGGPAKRPRRRRRPREARNGAAGAERRRTAA